MHSDPGSQFTSYEWQEFLEQLRNLVPSMSRRGNCWDNAVAESFFNLLKRERIRRSLPSFVFMLGSDMTLKPAETQIGS
ncbi:MAG: transposase family protein [Rhodobacter sp.]|nr:transposase family protein [Rhodobacter sp.]